MNHWLCKYIGCKVDRDCPDFFCQRCGAHYYHDGHDNGAVWRVWSRIESAVRQGIARVIGRKCDVCGKRFRSKYPYDPCCSKACHEQWIPF
jgi:hypothetical protein